MGWTTTDLVRNRLTLEDMKKNHVERLARHTNGIEARVIAHEWRPKTFYAILELKYPKDYSRTEDAGKTKTFLCTDIVELSPTMFGYKDMSEEMGPNLDDKPTPAFAQLVYKHIPFAPNDYAKEFRKWANIHFKDEKQLELI